MKYYAQYGNNLKSWVGVEISDTYGQGVVSYPIFSNNWKNNPEKIKDKHNFCKQSLIDCINNCDKVIMEAERVKQELVACLIQVRDDSNRQHKRTPKIR